MTHVMQWFAILMTRLKDIIIQGKHSNPSWFNRPYKKQYVFRKNKTRNWYDGPLEAIPSFPKRLDRKMFVELR